MILIDEPMSKHTTFGVGGPADVYIAPSSAEELTQVVKACRKLVVPYFILGRGSDLLVSDAGYRGVMIATEGLAGMEADGCDLVCESGVTLKDAAYKACELGLAGLEFASGIPGSVGGACFMNAGAYDGCMADVLLSVDVLTPEGAVQTLGVDELELGYRASRIRNEGLVVLKARMRLTPGDSQGIREKIEDLTRRREEKQPLEYGSAGSTFKRPEGYFAGKLIMDSGLKGYTVGGASVSQKHAGFVINKGDATASDVRAVIAHVQDEVERQFGVRLETEVLFIGW